MTLLIHEAGHIAAALICGAPLLGIRARPGGLSLVCRTERLSYPRAAFVYAGGAAANLLAAAAARVGGGALSPLCAFSVGAAVFNLLPLPGSDGVGILYSLICCFAGPGAAERISRAAADLGMLAFWVAAVYLSLTGQGGGAALAAAVLMLVCRFGGD